MQPGLIITKKKNMETNGLKLKTIATEAKPILINSNDDILNNSPQNSWFIAYLYDRVVIGRIINNRFEYYKNQNLSEVTIDNILKLKIFDKNSELSVWRKSSGALEARKRTDKAGDSFQVIDAVQVLFGTKAVSVEDNNEYSLITEKRGTQIILPLSELGIKNEEINEKEGRICIHTRSYVGYFEKTGQATFEDVRFVEFVKYGGI
jgi:CRISPR-associated protein (TIGR03984 family)